MFQAQIHHTKKDGTKGMKVITKTLKVTEDRQKMEEVNRLKTHFSRRGCCEGRLAKFLYE